MANRHLIVAAAAFAIISVAAVVVALVLPSWYIVDSSSGGVVEFGAFQFCGKGRTDCKSITRTDILLTSTCKRNAADLEPRFGAVAGATVAGGVLSVLGCGLLIAAFMRSTKTKAELRAERLKRAQEPGYIPTPVNDPRSDEERRRAGAGPRNPEADDEGDDDEPGEMPTLEIGAFFVMILAFALIAAGAMYFYYLTEFWMYCDKKPCDVFAVSNPGTSCEASLGYLFAIIVFAFVAAFGSAILVMIRWCTFCCCGGPSAAASGADGQQPHASGYYSHYGNPDAQELARREQVRQQYRPSEETYFQDRQKSREGEEQQRIQQQQAMELQARNAAQQQQQHQMQATNNAVAFAALIGRMNTQNLANTTGNAAGTTPSTARAMPGGGGGGGGVRNGNRVKKPGEPDCVLPEGDWEWDADSSLFWSEAQQYFYDHQSGHFYDPDSSQWFNPNTNEWYALS